MDIAQLLTFGVKNGASDMHLSAGLPPMIRVDGDMRRVNIPALDHAAVQAMVYDIMNDKQRKDFEEHLETDFSFEIPETARFRVNAFNQNRGCGAVFRTIPTEILTLEQLGAPRIFQEISEMPRGIVLGYGVCQNGDHLDQPQRSYPRPTLLQSLQILPRTWQTSPDSLHR